MANGYAPMSERERDELRRSDHDLLIRMEEQLRTLYNKYEILERRMAKDHSNLQEELRVSNRKLKAEIDDMWNEVKPLIQAFSGFTFSGLLIKYFGGAALIMAIIWNTVAYVVQYIGKLTGVVPPSI